MKTALLDERDGLRTFVVVFETGDEAASGLAAFAKEQGLSGSHFTAIGAFSRAVVAYFDWSSKQYRHVPIDEQVEVLSFAGDISIGDGQPKVHAHVVLGKSDATAMVGISSKDTFARRLNWCSRRCLAICTVALTGLPDSP
jgi:uncharacterized protein